MPNINEIKKSNFLKKEDCGQGILVTIKSVEEQNVAKEGVEPEMRWCVFFGECEKPLVLNSTNAQLIAGITGQQNTDGWTGHRVVLYNDPAISFQGKIVGGIRVRAPRGAAAGKAPVTAGTPTPAPRPAAPLAAPAEPEDDTIPF